MGLNIGLLGGLAQGLNQGVQSYQTERDYQDKKQKDALAQAVQNKMNIANLMEHGLEDDGSGGLKKTQEQSDTDEENRLVRQAGLVKAGQKIQMNPETGKKEIVPIPGFKDTDTELKKADIEHKRAETQKIAYDMAHPKTPPEKVVRGPEAVNLGQADAAVKELHDYQNLLKSAEDISGRGLNSAVAGVQGMFQMGENGKRAASIDTASDKVTRVLGTYLQKGVLDHSTAAAYKKMLPTRYDTPEVRDNKVQVLENLIAQRQNSELDALKQTGYKVEDVPRLNAPGGLLLNKQGSAPSGAGLIPSAQAATPAAPPMSFEEFKARKAAGKL